MTAAGFGYRAFGLSIASELEIPHLPICDPWMRRGDIDVVLRLGTVDDERVIERGRRQAIIPAHFRYQVQNGRDVTIDCLPGTDPRDIADMIMSWIMPVIAYQRGLLVLHASAIASNGHVLAFSGTSGAGKSTMAAAMAARGHTIVSDDMLVVKVHPGQRPMAFAGATFLKLSRQTLDHLGWQHDDLALANTSEEKFLGGPKRPNHTIGTDGLPLLALFQIGRGAFAMRPIRAINAAANWSFFVHSPDLLPFADRPKAIWQQWLDLVGSVQVSTLDQSGDFFDLSAAAIRVEKFVTRETSAANNDVRPR